MNFREILKPISPEMNLVTKEITSQIHKIYEGNIANSPYWQQMNRTVEYVFRVKGKMLRPALVLLTGKAVKSSDELAEDPLIQMAGAVELIHSASLIHDDIIDDSEMRRNQLSVNNKFGNHLAVLVGDILYSHFFSVVTSLTAVPNHQKIRLLDMFSRITKRMCMGEIYEEYFRSTPIEPSFDEYLFVIENKTASLMSLCCFTGAILNRADESVLERMADFGLQLGLAFQLVDDYLDDDSVFKTKAVLLQKAEEFINAAEDRIGFLKPSLNKECLLQIGKFILKRAE